MYRNHRASARATPRHSGRIRAPPRHPAHRALRMQHLDRRSNQMECTIKWVDGMSFIAETGTGHLVAMDGAPEAGGRNLAPRPDGVDAGWRGRLHGLRRGSHPEARPPRRARLQRTPRGRTGRRRPEGLYPDPLHLHRYGSQPEARNRRTAQSTSRRKSTRSASIMLGKTAEITHECEIIEADSSIMRARGSPPRSRLATPSPFRCDRSASSSPSTPASSPPSIGAGNSCAPNPDREYLHARPRRSSSVLDDRARLVILGRKRFQMALEVAFNLTLGFRQKPQVQA